MKLSIALVSLISCASTARLDAKMIHISDENEYKKIMLASQGPTVVEFAAEWCSVCTGIQRPMEDVSNDPEFAHIRFVHVDVDKCNGLCKERGIVGVPTFVYIQEGQERVKETGVQKIEDFSSHIRNNLRNHFTIAANQPTTSFDTEVKNESSVAAPSEPQESESNEGIVAKIVAFFSGLFTTIKNALKSIFASIKNIFKS